MENQHQKIKGYRDLTQAEIDLMNEAKALAEQCGAFCKKLECVTTAHPSGDHPDQRWLAIGRTDLQKGFMSVIRSIARPSTF
jgi:hypothetical protein